MQFAVQFDAAPCTRTIHGLRPRSQSACQPDRAVRVQGSRRSLARYASLVMVGKTLDELGLFEEVTPKHYSVKESVFPFNKFARRGHYSGTGDAFDRRGHGHRR